MSHNTSNQPSSPSTDPLSIFDPADTSLSDLQGQIDNLKQGVSPSSRRNDPMNITQHPAFAAAGLPGQIANSQVLPSIHPDFSGAHDAGMIPHHVFSALSIGQDDSLELQGSKLREQNQMIQDLRRGVNPTTGRNESAIARTQDLNARAEATHRWMTDVFQKNQPNNVSASGVVIGGVPYVNLQGGKGEDQWSHLATVEPTPNGGVLYLNGLRAPTPLAFSDKSGMVSRPFVPGSIDEQRNVFNNLFAGGKNPFPAVQANARRIQGANPDEMNRAIYNNPFAQHGSGGKADIQSVGTLPANMPLMQNEDLAASFGGKFYQRSQGVHAHDVEALAEIPGWYKDAQGFLNTGGKANDPGSAIKVSRLNARDYSHLGPRPGQEGSNFIIGDRVGSSVSGSAETGYTMNVGIIMSGDVIPEGMGIMAQTTIWDRSNKFFDLPEGGLTPETEARLNASVGKRMLQGDKLDINGQQQDLVGNWGGATVHSWGVQGDKLWVNSFQDTAPISLKYGGMKAHMAFGNMDDWGKGYDAIFGGIKDFNQFTSSVVNAMGDDEYESYVRDYADKKNDTSIIDTLMGSDLRHGSTVTPMLMDMMKQSYIPDNLKAEVVNRTIDKSTLKMLQKGHEDMLSSLAEQGIDISSLPKNAIVGSPKNVGRGRIGVNVNRVMLSTRMIQNAVPELPSYNATLNAQSLTGFAQALVGQKNGGAAVDQLASIGAQTRNEHMQIANAAFLNAGIEGVGQASNAYNLGGVSIEEARNYLSQSDNLATTLTGADLSRAQLKNLGELTGNNMLKIGDRYLAGAGAMAGQSVADDTGEQVKGAVTDYLGAIRAHMANIVGVAQGQGESDISGEVEAAVSSQEKLVETAGFQGAIQTPRSRSVQNMAYVADPILPPGSTVKHDEDLVKMMMARAQENGDKVSEGDIRGMIAGAKGNTPLFTGPATRYPSSDSKRQSVISKFYTQAQYAAMGGKLIVQQGQSIHDPMSVMAGGGDSDADRSAATMLGRFIGKGIESYVPTGMKEIIKSAMSHSAGEYGKQIEAWTGKNGHDVNSVLDYVQNGNRFNGSRLSPEKIGVEGTLSQLESGSQMGKTFNMGRKLMASMGVDDNAYSGSNAAAYEAAATFSGQIYQNPLDKTDVSSGVSLLQNLMQTSLTTGYYDQQHHIPGMATTSKYGDVGANLESFGNSMIRGLVDASEVDPQTAARMMAPSGMSDDEIGVMAAQIEAGRGENYQGDVVQNLQNSIIASTGKSVVHSDAPINFVRNSAAKTTASRRDKTTGKSQLAILQEGANKKNIGVWANAGMVQEDMKNLLSSRTGQNIRKFAQSLQRTGVATAGSKLWQGIRQGLGINTNPQSATDALDELFNEKNDIQPAIKETPVDISDVLDNALNDEGPTRGSVTETISATGQPSYTSKESSKFQGPYADEWEDYSKQYTGEPSGYGNGPVPQGPGGGSNGGRGGANFPSGGTTPQDPLWVRMMGMPTSQKTFDTWKKSYNKVTPETLQHYNDIIARGGPTGRKEAREFLNTDQHIKRVSEGLDKANTALNTPDSQANEYDQRIAGHLVEMQDLGIKDSIRQSNGSPSITAKAQALAELPEGKFDKVAGGESGSQKTLATAAHLGEVFNNLTSIMEKTAQSGGKLTEQQAKQVESYEKLADRIGKVVDAAKTDATAEPNGNGAKFLETFNAMGGNKALTGVQSALGQGGLSAKAAVAQLTGNFGIDAESLSFNEKFAPWMRRGGAGASARDAMRESGAWGQDGSLERGVWEVGGRALALPSQLINERYRIRGIQQEFLQPMSQARDAYLQYQQSAMQAYSGSDFFGGSNIIGSQAYNNAYSPVVAQQQQQINYGRQINQAYGGLITGSNKVLGGDNAANLQGIGSSVAAGIGIGGILGGGPVGMIAGGLIGGAAYIGGQTIDMANNQQRQILINQQGGFGKDVMGASSYALARLTGGISNAQAFSNAGAAANQDNLLNPLPGAGGRDLWLNSFNGLRSDTTASMTFAKNLIDANQGSIGFLTADAQNQVVTNALSSFDPSRIKMDNRTANGSGRGTMAYIDALNKSIALEAKSAAAGINLSGAGGAAATLGMIDNYSSQDTTESNFDNYRSSFDQNILSGSNTVLKGRLFGQYASEGVELNATQRAAGLAQSGVGTVFSRLFREVAIQGIKDPRQRMIAQRQLDQQGAYSQSNANNALAMPGGIFADSSGQYTQLGQAYANNGSDPIDFNRFQGRAEQDNAAYGQMVYGLNYNPTVANSIQASVAQATLQYDPKAALQAQQSAIALGGDPRKNLQAFSNQVASFAGQYQAGLNPMAGSEFKTQYGIDYTQGAIYKAGEAQRAIGNALGASQMETNNAMAENLYSNWRTYSSDANGAQYNRLQQLGSTQIPGQFQQTIAVQSGDPLANSLAVASQGLNANNAYRYQVQTGAFGGTAGRNVGYDENVAAASYAPIRANLLALNTQMGGDYLRPQDAGMTMQQLLGTNQQGIQSQIHTAQLALTNYQFAQQDVQIANQRASTTGVNLSAMQSQGVAAGTNAIDPNSGKTYTSALTNGNGQWNLEDQGVALQRRQQDWGLQMQGQQLQLSQQNFALAGQQYQENYAFNYGKTTTQLGWQSQQMQIDRSHQVEQQQWGLQDLAYQRDKSQVSFGFSMIQSQEDIRYATGRQRRDLMRNQNESVIMHSMDMGQQDKQEQRAKEQIQWSTEQFNLDKSHFQQNKEWTLQQMEMDKKHFDQNRTLEQEGMKLQEQDYAKQKQFVQEQRKNEDSQRDLQRANWLISQKQQEDMQTEVETTTKKVNSLNDAMQVWQTYMQNIGSLLQNQGQTGSVPSASTPISGNISPTIGVGGGSNNYPTQWASPQAQAQAAAAVAAGQAAAAASSHTASYTANAALWGFASGGYTGDGSTYQPAGIVHKGEYVIPQHGAPVVMAPELVELQRQMLAELKAMHNDGGNVVFQVNTANKNTAVKQGAALFNASWNN